MELKHIQATAERQNDKIVFIASDETKDRYGDSIPILNWDLKHFKKAPRLLVDHDHRVEKIVGKATSIKVDKNKKQLLFQPVFHGITELSRQVSEMVEAGHLDTVSVGFIPHPPDDKTKGTFEGKNELIEISFVTVPANPNAQQIKSLIEKEEKEEVKKDIDDYFVQKFAGEVTVKATEVQTLIFSKKEFSKDKAIEWAKDHTFKQDKIDETETSYRLRQFNPDMCNEGSERSISLQKGVRAVICKRNKNVDADIVVEPEATPTQKETKSDTVQKNPTRKSETSKGKGSGRSLSSDAKLQLALKKASKIINLALHIHNKESKNKNV